MFYGMDKNLPPALWMPKCILHSLKINVADQVAMARVCTLWRTAFQPLLDERWDIFQKSITWGRDQWLSLPGVNTVSEEPPLTDAQKIWLKAKLKSKCQFFNVWDDLHPHRFQNRKIKRTYQTFMLIFFPQMINETEVDLTLAGKCFSFVKTEGRNPGTVFYSLPRNENSLSLAHKAKATRSYFALVSLDVIPGSRQTAQSTKISLLHPRGCRMPTLLEAVMSLGIMNIRPSQLGRGFFFGKVREHLWTYTSTDNCIFFVGVETSKGIMGINVVNFTHPVWKDIGVAAVEEIPQ